MISSQNLQFSPEEAADFLRQVLRLDLAAEDITLLARRTGPDCQLANGRSPSL